MRAELFGCPIDILTMSETVDLARSAMAQQKTMVHVALNVAKLVNMRTDPILAEDVKKSDLIGIDGMGILYAAKLLGLPAKERVAGVDLLQELIGVCAKEGFRPFFLGATSHVLRAASERVTSIHPTIQFAGMHDGYFATIRSKGSSRKSAIVLRIVCSSQCQLLERSDFSPHTAVNCGFHILWEWAGL